MEDLSPVKIMKPAYIKQLYKLSKVSDPEGAKRRRFILYI